MIPRPSGFEKAALYLFPDTNVFIQCRSLNEVDWSEWGDFEQIHLIVCQAVQREMDGHKNRGNDRVGKRARKTCAVFRQIILNDQPYEIRESSPRVILSFDTSTSPTDLQLQPVDRRSHDDQLVECVKAYCERNDSLDVRLLTHDIGPMMTAKSIGVPFVPVPDHWLLPPEPNKAEKQLAKLSGELERMKELEPRFRTRCLDDDDKEIDDIAIAYTVYEPLADDDLTALLDSLTTAFPIATDFGPRKPIERANLWGWTDVYTPADDEVIEVYTTQEYPSWIEKCKSFLSNLHNELQDRARPVIRLGATNEGSRPGKNVLIILRAGGQFKIGVSPVEGENSDIDGENDLQLEKAPKPPRGEWKRTSALDWLSNLSDAVSVEGVLQHGITEIPNLSWADRSRDPDGFYYKPERPDGAVQSFTLECEQWRHGTEEEVFEAEIWVEGKREDISGAIELEIHAENLSRPTRRIWPVRICVTRSSIRDYAFGLVRRLSSPENEYD